MTAFALPVVVAITIITVYESSMGEGLGYWTSDVYWPQLVNVLPFPPNGLPSRLELFDIYPFVKTFFATVGVLGLLALVLHALRLPKILRGDAV